MKTVDVYIYDRAGRKPFRVPGGAELAFQVNPIPEVGIAGVNFTPFAAGWVRMLTKHGDWTVRMEEDAAGVLTVHVEPVIAPATWVPGPGVAVNVPSVEWYPAEVGEA